MRGCSVPIFVTCVDFDTTRGFVVLFEFEVRSRSIILGNRCALPVKTCNHDLRNSLKIFRFSKINTVHQRM